MSNELENLYGAYRAKESNPNVSFDGAFSGGGVPVKPNKGSEGDYDLLIQGFPEDRIAQYDILNRMAKDGICDSAINMHVAHAMSAKSDTGEIVFIESKSDYDDEIVNDLRDTFKGVLNENITKWAKDTGRLGYKTVRMYSDNKKGFVHFRDDFYTQPQFIKEYERAGMLAGFTHKYHDRLLASKSELIEPWKFIVFKMPQSAPNHMSEPVRFNPDDFDIADDNYMDEEPVETNHYGASLLVTAYEPWIDINNALMSIKTSRRNASKRDRFVGVNIGKDSPEQAAKYYNTLASQFRRKDEQSARRRLADGYVSTVNTIMYPVKSNGSGKVDINTEESPVDISAIEDLVFHVNRLAAALGVDKSLLGFSDDLGTGLGSDAFFRVSIIAAIKANALRRAMRDGIERMFEIHVAQKFGKVFTENDKPWKIVFNSLSSAVEREEQEAKESAVNFATSVATLMQMLDPNAEKFKFKEVVNHLFTDILKLDEEKLKNMVSHNEGDKTNSSGEGIMDSENINISDISIDNLIEFVRSEAKRAAIEEVAYLNRAA